jgi:hypothetical protein
VSDVPMSDPDTKPLSAEFWAGVVSPFLIFILAIPLILLKAWVLTWLWTWYIIPVFHVGPLRMVFAFGLSLTVNYLLPNINNDKNKGMMLFQAVFSPFLALFLGWIGTWFI